MVSTASKRANRGMKSKRNMVCGGSYLKLGRAVDIPPYDYFDRPEKADPRKTVTLTKLKFLNPDEEATSS